LTGPNLGRVTILWLDNHGFKPVETEVPVMRGWVADIAGVIEPTHSEAVKLRLVPRKPNWTSFQTDLERYVAGKERHENAYGSLPFPITVLVEVKTSLADLRRERKMVDAEWHGYRSAICGGAKSIDICTVKLLDGAERCACQS
jgi:hypothetical protein